MTSSRFKPQKLKTIDQVLSEKMKRTIRSYNAIHREYVPNKTDDKYELECSIYKQKFPQTVERKLMTLIRVRVPKGQFETDSSGTIDHEYKVKEALVYTISEKVTGPDPNYPDSELIVNLAQCSTKMGYYTKPIASIRHDSLGNPVDSQVHSWVNMFYIPFTEENVRNVLKEFDYSYKGLALANAVQGYAEKFYGQFKYSVYNLENFIHADFDDLLQANQKGFLKNKDPTYAGAVQDYVVDKEKKRELAQREYTDFKEKQRKRSK